jgi:hypothetical protein
MPQASPPGRDFRESLADPSAMAKQGFNLRTES